MNLRKVGRLMRRAWPLRWPVELRHADLPFPTSGLHYIRKSRRRKIHVILVHPEHSSGDTIIHEWAHAAHVEDPTYKEPTSDPETVQGILDSHPVRFFLLYGMIYRAVIVRLGEVSDFPEPTERNP